MTNVDSKSIIRRTDSVNDGTPINGISHSRCVKMYDDLNVYATQQIYYGCGSLDNVGQYANRVSSLEIPSRTCATLYDDFDYKGNMRTFCNYSYNKGKIVDKIGDVDNKMRSFRIFELNEN